MLIYLGVYRPFKHAVTNIAVALMEMFLAAVYLECVNLRERYTDKGDHCKILQTILNVL
jgi:hypothetical protein